MTVEASFWQQKTNGNHLICLLPRLRLLRCESAWPICRQLPNCEVVHCPLLAREASYADKHHRSQARVRALLVRRDLEGLHSSTPHWLQNWGLQ